MLRCFAWLENLLFNPSKNFQSSTIPGPVVKWSRLAILAPTQCLFPPPTKSNYIVPSRHPLEQSSQNTLHQMRQREKKISNRQDSLRYSFHFEMVFNKILYMFSKIFPVIQVSPFIFCFPCFNDCFSIEL